MAGILALALLAVTAGPDPVGARGNAVLLRDARQVVYSLAALPRFGVLLGGGAEVMQRFGFGAALQFQIHGLGIGIFRPGLEITAGHTHVLDRRSVATDAGGKATRWASLGHTDFTAGPSLQFRLGATFLTVAGAAGVSISQLVRPTGPFSVDEQQVTSTAAMVRTGLALGIPIRHNQGIVLGQAVQVFFSNTQVVARPDPSDPEQMPDTSPFDLLLESQIGYQMWF